MEVVIRVKVVHYVTTVSKIQPYLWQMKRENLKIEISSQCTNLRKQVTRIKIHTATSLDPSLFQAIAVMVYRLGISLSLDSSQEPFLGLQLNTRNLQTKKRDGITVKSH